MKLKNCERAVRAVIVVHRHFGDAEAGVLDLLHHLEADDAAVFSRLTRSKIARRISRKSQSTSRTLQPEQQLHGVVIDAADDDAVQRIGAADLAAVHHVGVGRQAVPQQRSSSAGSYCASPSV